jgi:hypothetical protein
MSTITTNDGIQIYYMQQASGGNKLAKRESVNQILEGRSI